MNSFALAWSSASPTDPGSTVPSLSNVTIPYVTFSQFHDNSKPPFYLPVSNHVAGTVTGICYNTKAKTQALSGTSPGSSQAARISKSPSPTRRSIPMRPSRPIWSSWPAEGFASQRRIPDAVQPTDTEGKGFFGHPPNAPSSPVGICACIYSTPALASDRTDGLAPCPVDEPILHARPSVDVDTIRSFRSVTVLALIHRRELLPNCTRSLQANAVGSSARFEGQGPR